MLNNLLRLAFFTLIVRPFVYVLLGLNVRNWQRLPKEGPALIVANHNSHLDTLVLMSLLPLRQLHNVRPVAAADYFLRNPLLAWFATKIIGIIPISRSSKGGNPLAGVFDGLRQGQILILFPEGSRGEPEKMQAEFKQGVRIVARKFPDVPVHPLFLHGLGKALPKGEGLFVPFFCDVFIGHPISYESCAAEFTGTLFAEINSLADSANLKEWV